MSTTRTTKAAALARVQALIAGTQKHFASAQFTLSNTVYTTASLVALLQSVADAITSLNAAQASARDAVKTAQGVEAKAAPVIRDYRRFVLATFGTSIQQLADFGMQPPKARAPRTVEQKATTAAKLRATRKARGTTSKKQKLAIKGDVTGITVTPVTTPQAAPSPAPQPASNASSAPSPAGQGSASK
jgi:hypothetical protein